MKKRNVALIITSGLILACIPAIAFLSESNAERPSFSAQITTEYSYIKPAITTEHVETTAAPVEPATQKAGEIPVYTEFVTACSTEAPVEPKTAPTRTRKIEPSTQAPIKELANEKPKAKAQKKETTKAVVSPKTTESRKNKTVTKETDSSTEPVKTECDHKWVWETKTVLHDAVTHEEPVYSDPYYEYIRHDWIKCGNCHELFSTVEQYESHPCWPECSSSHPTTYEEILHPAEIIDYETVVDTAAYDEEVNDYQYCSICGKKK